MRRYEMNRRVLLTLATLLAVSTVGRAADPNPPPATAKAVTVRGWITDALCGAANANEKGKECALTCYKKGSKLVLYTDDKKTYALSDQESAVKNLGHEVNVTGTIDDKG